MSLREANNGGMADNTTKITELTEITEAGVRSASVDGMSAQVDLGQAKKSLREAKLTDQDSIDSGLVRPVVFRTRLRGAW